MNRSLKILTLAAAVAASFSWAGAQAQGWPTKAVRILVATPAGGPGDVVARGGGQVLSQITGQPFVVENRVGADGMISGEACARSAPDGYTLCLADNYAITVNPVIRDRMPYDPFRDLTPIVHFGYLAAAILVHPSVPVQSLRELFDMAKAKPNAITFGAYGLNSSAHLYIEWFRNAKGIAFYNVPYKAASLAWPAMLAGQVQAVVFAVGPAAKQVQAGKAKALMVTTSKRSAHMPDVPTFKEAGVDIDIVTWFGLFGPAGLPKDIVQRLNTELSRNFINNAAMREKFLSSQGIEIDTPAGGTPDQFAALLGPERDRFASIVKVAKVKMD